MINSKIILLILLFLFLLFFLVRKRNESFSLKENFDTTCVDPVPGWVDKDGHTCANWVSGTSQYPGAWCAADGTTGSGWKSNWGTIADYANDGHDATTACCGCGARSRRRSPVKIERPDHPNNPRGSNGKYAENAFPDDIQEGKVYYMYKYTGDEEVPTFTRESRKIPFKYTVRYGTGADEPNCDATNNCSPRVMKSKTKNYEAWTGGERKYSDPEDSNSSPYIKKDDLILIKSKIQTNHCDYHKDFDEGEEPKDKAFGYNAWLGNDITLGPFSGPRGMPSNGRTIDEEMDYYRDIGWYRRCQFYDHNPGRTSSVAGSSVQQNTIKGNKTRYRKGCAPPNCWDKSGDRTRPPQRMCEDIFNKEKCVATRLPPVPGRRAQGCKLRNNKCTRDWCQVNKWNTGRLEYDPTSLQSFYNYNKIRTCESSENRVNNNYNGSPKGLRCCEVWPIDKESEECKRRKGPIRPREYLENDFHEIWDNQTNALRYISEEADEAKKPDRTTNYCNNDPFWDPRVIQIEIYRKDNVTNKYKKINLNEGWGTFVEYNSIHGKLEYVEDNCTNISNIIKNKLSEFSPKKRKYDNLKKQIEQKTKLIDEMKNSPFFEKEQEQFKNLMSIYEILERSVSDLENKNAKLPNLESKVCEYIGDCS
jgi:hypothetical protein